MDMINNVLVVVGISYEYHTLARDIANYERELARVSASIVVVCCDIITTEGIID